MDLSLDLTPLLGAALYVALRLDHRRRLRQTKPMVKRVSLPKPKIVGRAEGFILLVAMLTMIVALAILRWNGSVSPGDILAFAGAAFGSIVAIYGARKIETMRQDREFFHAQEDLLDIARSIWEVAPLLPDDGGFFLSVEQFKARRECIEAVMCPTLSRLAEVPASTCSRNLAAKRDLTFLRTMAATLNRLLAAECPLSTADRDERMEEIQGIVQNIVERAGILEGALTGERPPPVPRRAAEISA